MEHGKTAPESGIEWRSIRGIFFFFIYILGVFLSFFFREGTARRKGWEANARHFILVNFSLGITLLLFILYPQDSRPPKVTWWTLPHDFVIQAALIALDTGS